MQTAAALPFWLARVGCLRALSPCCNQNGFSGLPDFARSGTQGSEWSGGLTGGANAVWSLGAGSAGSSRACSSRVAAVSDTSA
eukprot:6653481-Alexandrium_andersonii.AAC.1